MNKEKGAATLLLIMVLLVLSALLGALAIRGATSDLKMAGSQRLNRTTFYCAEAGINYARPIFASHYSDWAAILNGGTPSFTYPVTAGINPTTGQIDTSLKDFSVTLEDNVDENPNNPKVDNDLMVVLVSTCTNSALTGGTTRTLKQMIQYTATVGNDYRYQAGHSSTHSGNEN